MGAILLRTLALKSIINCGKWEGYSIQQMLDLRHTYWIRWSYFNQSMISYTDEILNKVGVTEEYRIKKPGVDKEMFNKCQQAVKDRMWGISKHILKVKQKKRSKGRLGRLKKNLPSKGQMQAKNHGK